MLSHWKREFDALSHARNSEKLNAAQERAASGKNLSETHKRILVEEAVRLALHQRILAEEAVRLALQLRLDLDKDALPRTLLTQAQIEDPEYKEDFRRTFFRQHCPSLDAHAHALAPCLDAIQWTRLTLKD
tara:strand:- start:30 stop:422 length:393 start_codon:yes stop_codon:yes gene_type:complete